MEKVRKTFEKYDFPLVIEQNIIPNDNSTLFVCSGMQNLKNKFSNPDNTHYGTLQSCIRTNDLELIGDGQHLSYFQMLGNFSFGNNDYKLSVELWKELISDLGIPVTSIHVHPDRDDHKKLWKGFEIVDDPDCVWSDGKIGGHCCEMYSGNLEIGNLVNTLSHSTDVGFGWERMFLVIENKNRVDETSLFDQDVHPIVRDHSRTVRVMLENGVKPGSKGREYICRRLVRRMLPHLTKRLPYFEIVESEKSLLERKLKVGRRKWKKFKDKPPEWWYETFGIFPEEMRLLY